MIRVGSLLALGIVATGEERMARRVHGDSDFDTNSQIDEITRREVFVQRHGSWPDPQWLKRELPSYSRAMAEREARIMEITESQARWDAWMFVAQARMLYTFTPTQWKVVDAPLETWLRLRAQYHISLAANPPVESSTATLSGVYGPMRPNFLEQEVLNYEVLNVLKPLHEAWAGVELEPTSVYGVRVYRNGSTLKDHLDVPESHVISSIFHVDSDLDAPFPLEIEDATGVYSRVDLKPGQMCFYESAKAFHRRSIPMRGRHYGSLFLHYRPKNWTFSRDQIRLAVPPFWNHGLKDRSLDKEPETFETALGDHSTVTFKLLESWPQHRRVDIFWLPDPTSPGELYATLGAGTSTHVVDTYVGHNWRAATVSDDDSHPSVELARFTVTRATEICTIAPNQKLSQNDRSQRAGDIIPEDPFRFPPLPRSTEL